MNTTEMHMLRWARGKTRLDHVRNVEIWKEAGMYPTADFFREKMIRWSGHVQMRDKDDATRRIIADDGRRKAESRKNKAEMARPKLRWRDVCMYGEKRYGQKP